MHVVEKRRGKSKTYTEPLLPSSSSTSSNAVIAASASAAAVENYDDVESFITEFYASIIFTNSCTFKTILREHAETVGVHYSNLVPNIVSYDKFWLRYMYRCSVTTVIAELRQQRTRQQQAHAVGPRRRIQLALQRLGGSPAGAAIVEETILFQSKDSMDRSENTHTATSSTDSVSSTGSSPTDDNRDEVDALSTGLLTIEVAESSSAPAAVVTPASAVGLYDDDDDDVASVVKTTIKQEQYANSNWSFSIAIEDDDDDDIVENSGPNSELLNSVQ